MAILIPLRSLWRRLEGGGDAIPVVVAMAALLVLSTSIGLAT